MNSFFWFDFETFGVNPVKDKPSQFAGIRTDFNFNVIDDPVNIYCKPSDDFIPHPDACLITGITPQIATEKGLIERDFFKQIHLELSEPHTCAVGYNNIRFDDELVRHGFYRNFYDAYEREWQNGNSRWDIIDLLRMTHALRPEGINWPVNEKGNVTFRLEKLTEANHIAHENAHDALTDVYATIGMAKLVSQKQPKLYQFLLGLRDKRQVATEVDPFKHTPFVHSSGMLGPKHHYTAIMLPICQHPSNKNSVICLDLTKANDGICELSPEQLEARIFTRQEKLPEGVERLGVKEVHYNKCPAVAPLGVMNEQCQQRLEIDLNACLERAKDLAPQLKDLANKLRQVYQSHQFPEVSNPDHALYSGGFFSAADKAKMARIRQQDWTDLANNQFHFSDQRLDELLFRYRARNAPESLTNAERDAWQDFRRQQFFDPDGGSSLLYEDYKSRIQELQQGAKNPELLLRIESYVEQLIASLN
ncbi:MAG: exodeoxyribonuclease I [Enterobacterales bacterium]|nr:exodeoxyribonuclease I [Enterobacterales bacterium]